VVAHWLVEGRQRETEVALMPFQVNETGLYVFVPQERRPVGKCTVITRCTDDGEITHCGTPLYSRQEFERHVANCSRQHHDQIRKASLRHRMPGFHDPEQAGIPDVSRWLDEQDAAGVSNRQKVIAGRRKL
jgi:hypothetical protein